MAPRIWLCGSQESPRFLWAMGSYAPSGAPRRAWHPPCLLGSVGRSSPEDAKLVRGATLDVLCKIENFSSRGT